MHLHLFSQEIFIESYKYSRMPMFLVHNSFKGLVMTEEERELERGLKARESFIQKSLKHDYAEELYSTERMRLKICQGRPYRREQSVESFGWRGAGTASLR